MARVKTVCIRRDFSFISNYLRNDFSPELISHEEWAQPRADVHEKWLQPGTDLHEEKPSARNWCAWGMTSTRNRCMSEKIFAWSWYDIKNNFNQELMCTRNDFNQELMYMKNDFNQELMCYEKWLQPGTDVHEKWHQPGTGVCEKWLRPGTDVTWEITSALNWWTWLINDISQHYQ